MHAQQDICKEFDIPSKNVVLLPFFRSNLKLSVIPVRIETRDDIMIELFSSEGPDLGPAIVYATTQKEVEEIASKLKCVRGKHPTTG